MYKKLFILALFLILGTIAVVWVAFYNGYPLVYSDTGAYLNSSIQMESPSDRPIFYGVFLRITHMQAHNWIPIIFQGLIGYWLIYRTVRLVANKNRALWAFLATLVLAVATGLPWYAAQLMPDIFTSYGILAMMLIFYDRDKKYISALYFLILFLAAGVHLSNVLILGMTWMMILLIQFKNVRQGKKSFWLPASISLLLVAAVFPLQSWFNYMEHGVFKVSREANLFHVAKGLESHMYQTYVQENKHRISIPFAEKTDSFPDNPMWFLWAQESPMSSCGKTRIEMSREFAPVVKDMFSKWKYRKWFLKEMFRSGYEQLKFHKIGSGLVAYQENSAPYGMIFNEFKNELPAFKNARQFKSGLELNYHLEISKYIFNISWIIFLLGFILPYARKKLGIFLLILLTGVIANHLITGGLANIYDRLAVRVVWLISFGALLTLFVFFQSLRKEKVSMYNEIEH